MTDGLVRIVLLTALIGVLAACGEDNSPRAPTPTATLAPTTVANTPTLPPTNTETARPSATATATASATPVRTADPLSGGATTVFNVSRNAFALPAANLEGQRQSDFFVGNAFFNRNWVTAPSSTVGSDGLGPLFNARSCSACHFKDGRGRPPETPDEFEPSLLFRLSVPNPADPEQRHDEPHYGDQLQPSAILGVPAEAAVSITYTEEAGQFGDGSPYQLQRPRYEFGSFAYGPLADDVQVSPRVAPAIIGLGLLAALSEETVLARADAEDADGNGISGRPNRVWDIRQQRMVLGRFGWKANQPTIEQQTAGAFLGDMGLTTPLFEAQNCTAAQPECAAAPTGGEPEVDRRKLDLVTFYSHFLSVPARRAVDDPVALRGDELFTSAGCAACHTATMITGDLDGFPELSGQVIHPYTDLLLHDLGEGLADNRPDSLANGREWRTPPLWGIGLVETVNRHTRFLHDGRARDFVEAILWHGGEAEAAKERFRTMSAADRDALVTFLKSL